VVAVPNASPMSGKAHLCEVLCQRHCKLPGPGDVATALFRVHVRYLDLVVLGDGLLDVVDRDLPVWAVRRSLSASLAVSSVMSRPLKRE